MLALLLACVASPPAPARSEPRDLVSLVDPRIGTGGQGYGVGCAFPGAAAPFGLVKVSPDTADDSGAAPGFYHGGGYHDDDELIEGFSHLHAHGIGLTAYGLINLMPTDGMSEEKRSESGYRLPFSHDSELARPGYYAVTVGDGDDSVDVALAATEHTALHRYSFHGAASPTVLLDLEHVLSEGAALGGSVQIDPATGQMTGWMDNQGQMGPAFRVWFAILPERVPASFGVWADADPVEGATAGVGQDIGAWLSFQLDDGSVALRVAISLVDQEGALANLAAEHTGFDVDADAAATLADWSDLLSSIEVWGGDDDEAVIFATALYHAALMPTIQSDVDGRYLGFDDEIHVADGWKYHSDFSLWDTYRTAHPLYSLLWPDLHQELLYSLDAMASQGGALPRWPLANGDAGAMLGSPAQIVVGEAWQKGVITDNALAERLYQAAASVALGESVPSYGGRPDVATYDALGYYPSDEVGASVAWTMEVATADAALADMADALGHADEGAILRARGGAFTAVFDEDVGFFHGRLRDGSFDPNFDESRWLDEYTEGNARQYLWLATQDPPTLIATLGGAETFVSRLDEFMANGAEQEDEVWPNDWYWHGNEVDLHAPWLFALAGRPDLTRTWVDQVARASYSAAPDGLAGNDDGGTLSAWYVFAAMGLYPLAGTDQYVLGQPRFDAVRFPFQGGQLSVAQVGVGELAGVALDGAPWTEPTLRHSDLGPGSSLVFLGEGLAP